ncbi:hypothetical protein HK099_006047 [Clydaea vesicula]|uniref:Transmembrane protein 223 n=1 Tax=Clydaea vesicula TaxID=447962 RepID=A0AAD5U859_9FUNG|nr:hypothetical protein HK099_006047 [Clydaea vesicula]KAJ3397518.1 hypothetical protein HDU92_007181 [Lobulomyces angularis]
MFLNFTQSSNLIATCLKKLSGGESIKSVQSFRYKGNFLLNTKHVSYLSRNLHSFSSILHVRKVTTKETKTSFERGFKDKFWSEKKFLEDTVLFENQSKTKNFTKIIYFCAGTQLLFWILVADFVLRELVDEETKKKASLTKRLIYATSCVSVGIAFAAMVQYYAHRRLSRLVLLKGGKECLIEASNLFGRKGFVVPTQTIKIVEEKKFKVTDSLMLRLTNHKKNFLLDKAGEFPNKSLFYYMFNSQ